MPEQTSLHLEILAELGVLSRQLGNVEAQNTLIIAEQERAAEGRQAMYQRLGALEIVAAEVKRLTPLVDNHEIKYQQSKGAAIALKALWGAMAGGGGAAVVLIARKLGLIN